MNETVPQNLTNAIASGSDIVGGLPAPIQTSFFKAMGRLVGGALATPAAWLRRPAQAVEDKTDAKSLVMRKIAEAVAEKAAADPDIIDRALDSLVREEFRKQANKESVAQSTAESIVDTQLSEEKMSSGGEIDDDWMNVFVRYAEDASSERMQKLWGRVLAGEIRQPGAFSLKTIRFLSELDTDTAKLFEEFASLVTKDMVFFDNQKDNAIFNKALDLESSGLVTVGAGMLSRENNIGSTGICHILGREFCLQVEAKEGSQINIPVIPLTRLGMEVIKLLPLVDERPQFLRMSTHIQKNFEVNKIALCQLVYDDGNPTKARFLETLWEGSKSNIS